MLIMVLLAQFLINRSHSFQLKRSITPFIRRTGFATLKAKGKENKYSGTVFLPNTKFDQRANSVIKEPAIQKWWADENIYDSLLQKSTGEQFTLHDGPPYANGNLHIGHALNKILKDFILKYQMLKGKKVNYIPGWDCHGLPIEHKVIQELSPAERQGLTPQTLRIRAAEFAKEAVDIQMKGFKRFGVWGDWSRPYLTMSPEYEAAQLTVFGKMVEKGFIFRGLKPVYWSPSSKSALAEAELEYPLNHTSRSVYVSFDLCSASPALTDVLQSINIPAQALKLAIWTTTPWTIPANLAVSISPSIVYAIVSHPEVAEDTKFVVAADLIDTFFTVISPSADLSRVILHAKLSGQDLFGSKYCHPLNGKVCEVVFGGDYINTSSGTGLVHTAPGHGHEDYLTGMKYDLPAFSPVDDCGKFTLEAGEDFQGLDVLDAGNHAVIKALEQKGSLLKEHSYSHKYPYDWRTKRPIIVRATEQWFTSLESFRSDVLDAIKAVDWVPSSGSNRLATYVTDRPEWCISRQRSWGVPIPVFYHKDTGATLMNAETINHIAALFKLHGSSCWWTLSIPELLPPGPLQSVADMYVKGTDTMDVWFDSGTSWAGVLQDRGLNYPADVYLEGSDQHRGWFQSSLLTSVAVNGISPFKSVVTHGFVLDEKGFKMSKSLGNVVDPMTIIQGGSDIKKLPAYGADTLRLWVSSVDFSVDVCIGDNIMKTMSDTYRKFRNTLRFIVGSIDDFNPAKDQIIVSELPRLDRHMLGRLTALESEVQAAYESFQFFKAHQLLLNFCSVDLSAFYLDIAKDRLYIAGRNDFRRRSCQTVLYITLEKLAVMLAPITPHLSEDLWQNLPYEKASRSVFEHGWLTSTAFPPVEQDAWQTIKALRNDVNVCIESARRSKTIGASQEAKVYLFTENKETKDMLAKMILKDSVGSDQAVDDLRYIFITSQVELVNCFDEFKLLAPSFRVDTSESSSGVAVGVAVANGHRCERCWFYCESVGGQSSHSDLCSRCHSVISNM